MATGLASKITFLEYPFTYVLLRSKSQYTRGKVHIIGLARDHLINAFFGLNYINICIKSIKKYISLDNFSERPSFTCK